MTRTTIDLDPVVLRQLKARQRKEGKTLGRLASDLLAQALANTDPAPPSALRWTAADLGPLVDLDDKEAVARALGDDERR
ncbi:MAG: hypothetical protein ACRDPT_15025 [Streptomycetales bacterium]